MMGGGARNRFLWDGFTFTTAVVTSPSNLRNRWFSMAFNAGKGGLEEVKSQTDDLTLMDLWDNTTDPSIGLFERIALGEDALDPIVLWNGGAGSDYTYVVTETLGGTATAATNALSAGSHAGTDITSGSSPRLTCGTYGTAASWQIEIVSTHNPTGRVRTGVLNFEFV